MLQMCFQTSFKLIRCANVKNRRIFFRINKRSFFCNHNVNTWFIRDIIETIIRLECILNKPYFRLYNFFAYVARQKL